MELTKGELFVLEQVAKGNKTVKEIAIAFKKSEPQIYIYVKKLTDKSLIDLNNGDIEPKKIPYVSLLLQLLSKTPNLTPILEGPGIPIFTAMLKPSTLEEITNETGYKKTAIYKRLQEARKRSLVRKKLNTFEINDKMWTELKETLEEIKKSELKTDNRIPVSAIIYYKKKDEIVFSSKEELDAVKTAFSAYQNYGIDLLTITNFYYLPKKTLTKEDILQHSLYIIEKDNDIRYLIFIALFYAKYKKEIKIQHQIIGNISLVLAGKDVKGYPTIQEIKDRAEVYKIKV
jgi:predicted transcriptional regulator